MPSKHLRFLSFQIHQNIAAGTIFQIFLMDLSTLQKYQLSKAFVDCGITHFRPKVAAQPWQKKKKKKKNADIHQNSTHVPTLNWYSTNCPLFPLRLQWCVRSKMVVGETVV
uniref:Uncharacterized protein LOC104213014 n=1 Tax=Nicotiana sylvestris TaxID=4096 RepID=A0A1U7VFR9_NICSY|nr:PREDICTED: uncharacterized protein LOC104213014 [Nicotiana sylvestris]